jgi:ferredoxin
MLNFSVNTQRCNHCGLCVQDCPSRIIEQTADAVPFIRPENEGNCIQCQHCLAVCPTAAVSIFGRDPDASLPLTPAALPKAEQMARLICARRTVRRYRDENVDPELLRHLLATVSNAPSGVNRRKLMFSVIDDKQVMQALRMRTLNGLVAADKAGKIRDSFVYLKQAPAAYENDRTDIIFRTAPHALIISAGPEAACPQEDSILAMAYFDLLAQSAGLGTVWWGLLKMVTLVLPDIKAFLGVPADHPYFYGMLFGVPAVSYPRTVQRSDAATIRRIAG